MLLHLKLFVNMLMLLSEFSGSILGAKNHNSDIHVRAALAGLKLAAKVIHRQL